MHILCHIYVYNCTTFLSFKACFFLYSWVLMVLSLYTRNILEFCLIRFSMTHHKPDHRWHMLLIMLIIKTENNINYTTQQMFNLWTGISKLFISWGAFLNLKIHTFNQTHAKEKKIISALFSLNNPSWLRYQCFTSISYMWIFMKFLPLV